MARRIGTTTRIVDRAVQDYFTQGYAIFSDPAIALAKDKKQHEVILRHTLDVFLVRMLKEHMQRPKYQIIESVIVVAPDKESMRIALKTLGKHERSHGHYNPKLDGY